MKKLAVVGATGLVGQKVLEVLKEESLSDSFELYMFVSDKSAGKVMIYNDRHYLLMELDEQILDIGFDYAIFLTSETISKVWVPKFARAGAIVIDNSSAFRMKKNIPLIVPEINFNLIKNQDKIIANPNCSTIQLVLVLDRLKNLSKIKRVVVSSYQSVSGAGKDALKDLNDKSNNFFIMGITDNIIPQIGEIDDGGNCAEENKIINETKKILGIDSDVYATTVRVPTSFCHGESVFVEFESNIDIKEVKKALNVRYIKQGDMFYLTDCTQTNLTYVCRIRQSSNKIIQFFIIADNLRRGASYNAVEILRLLNRKNAD